MKLVVVILARMRVAGLGVVLALALAGRREAQSVTLNEPLARELRGGTVSDFLYTPSGTRVVYRTDRDALGRYELFSRPLDGAMPSVKLNGPLAADGDVGANGNLPGSFAVGADDRVVYLADETVNNVSELFVVPADGSASRVRLSQPGASVVAFALDPAGTRAVYRQGSGLGEPSELHVVPLDGSAAPLPLAPGSNVDGTWIAPDGGAVVFAVWDAAFAGQELFVAPLDGSAAPTFLAETQPPGLPFAFRYFDDLVFTPDGARVVYTEVDDEDGSLSWILYSVPLDGSLPADALGAVSSPAFALGEGLPARVAFRQAGALFAAAADGSGGVQLSPAGWSAQDGPLALGDDVLFEAFLSGTGSTLYRAPLDGSAPATPLFAAGSTIGPFTPAGPATLAFVRNTGGAKQLHSVPLAGGTPLPLHPLPPGSQGPLQILPHPDGERVLFRADDDTAGVVELYIVPLDASSAPLRLNDALDAGGDVFSAALTPDEEHVVYRAGPGAFTAVDLFRATLDGSAPPMRLNEHVPGATVGDVTSFLVTPDHETVVYRADQEVDEEFALYAHAADGAGTPLPLSADLGSVLPGFVLSSAGTRVVFATEGAEFALHTARLDGSPPLTLESSTHAPADLAVSPAGTRCVYRRLLAGSDHELRSIRLDGSSASVPLHAPLAAGRTVAEFRVGAGVVVFLSDLAQDEVFELYAVPIAGGTPVRVSATPVAGGDVSAFALDAAGECVVYLADARVNNRVELYWAPLDGSRAPTRLNGALAPGGDVMEFVLTPDGERVLYRADQRADAQFELFRVRLPAPRPPHGRPGAERRPRALPLVAVPPGAAVQSDWILAPGALHVLYRAAADAPGALELYRAALDGAAPVKLNAPLVADGDVLAFALAPDQSRVVYHADQRADDVQELFSVPFAGGAAAELAVLPDFADVSAFGISPGSLQVAFLADRETDGVLELHRVPLDGGSPWRVHPALAPGRDVQPDFVALDASVLYRADQDQEGVIELHLGHAPALRLKNARPR